MDADDELSSDGKEKILNIVNNDKSTGVYFFKTYSYVGDEENNDIVMNINIRLIRNNRGYKFIGDIHEQILPGPEDMGRLDAMKVGDVIFYHYGYLNEEIKLKDKRNRNIRIISKILEKNPNDNFMLFNMGSEYFALCDFNTALYYYKKAYEKFNPGFGYSSKLILRIAGCYEYLGRFNEELKIIDEGLKYYPHFTDLEFMRAKVYFIQNKFTLAIKSLKKCIKMGDAPFYLGELVGVGTFKAYELLAKIYYELQDYNSALRYAKKAYKLKDNRENFLFLAKIILESQNLSKAEEFLQKEAKKGKKYLILSEAFFEQKMFNKALKYLEKESREDIEKINFYKGKYLFYSKKLEESRAILIKVNGKYFEEALKYLTIIDCLLDNIDEALKYVEMMSEYCVYSKKVYSAFLKIIKFGEKEILSDDKEESRKYIGSIFELLSMLIKAGFYDEFEKSLQLLNLIDNDEVLILLAKLYYENKAYSLAIEEFKRSIKIFDKIDLESLEMMKKSYLALL